MPGEELRFDGQVVVVTGAGGGLGKAYATFFAGRGAKVVVNDLGASLKGEANSTRAADVVVNEIKAAGGTAVANYDSVEHGERIIDTAVRAFGRVDVLINNAGILRDVAFKNQTDQDWDLIMKVHVDGAYRCTRAAWPHFRKQKYGRVVNTASAAGLFGSFGQTNYSAAKLAMVGFTETLAKEGQKYNIVCNVIAPIAASRMTETVMPSELLKALDPVFVVPLVAILVHRDNTDETGSIFEVGGGHVAKLRWERSEGLLLKADDSYTPGAILKRWDRVFDFSSPQYPSGPNDFMALLEDSLKMGPNDRGETLDLSGRVALVTGGGAGIGRAYCLAFARHGAAVVVNDLANPDSVVGEIKQLGGSAVGVKASAEDGDAVVKAAVDAFGRLDIVVNNAGILRDKAFANMDEALWRPVLDVHLRGTYKVTKAAWPIFLKQKYGRVVNTTSTSGIYGNFGQANYAAAKCGILGFSRALALEGAKHNILVNTIAPNAGTAMTATVMPEEMVQAFKPDYIAPLVLALCSDKVPKHPTGQLYEVGSGWVGATRWQRSGGQRFPVSAPLTPEVVLARWDAIVDFDDGRADHPTKTTDAVQKVMENMGGGGGAVPGPQKKKQEQQQSAAPSSGKDNEYLRAIKRVMDGPATESEFSYEDRDVILYNLGIGAKKTDLAYVYENDANFHPLPTFFVLPALSATQPYSFDEIVPNFSPMKLLHGEQFLELAEWPLPSAAKLVSRARLLEVLDKGPDSAAVVRAEVALHLAGSDKLIARNEGVMFLRGCGGFSGPAHSRFPPTSPSVAENTPPKRKPDLVVEDQTSPEQAALYRLSGDWNPLHVDPAFSRMGGFKVPILHGLCSFGFSGRALYEAYGPFRNIKVRFAGTVVPGQTLVTEMWKEDGGRRIVFQTRVKETGKLAISNAAAELMKPAQ
jgi:multifunctional beta-oxidation protein